MQIGYANDVVWGSRAPTLLIQEFKCDVVKTTFQQQRAYNQVDRPNMFQYLFCFNYLFFASLSHFYISSFYIMSCHKCIGFISKNICASYCLEIIEEFYSNRIPLALFRVKQIYMPTFASIDQK